MAISKGELLAVEKKYSAYGRWTEAELEAGLMLELRDAFDQELAFERRVVALEAFLARQFYLHSTRLESATDPKEENMESALVERFARIFFDENHRLINLYRYCDTNAAAYYGKRRPEEGTNWQQLADEIRKEIVR